jgi:signal transduction histidine kinase
MKTIRERSRNLRRVATSTRRAQASEIAPPPPYLPEVETVIPPPPAVRKEQQVKQEMFPLISVAHELKTPLAVMMGYTDLLRGEHLGTVTERQREVLDQMQESGTRLRTFIDNLLLLAAFSADKTNLELEPEDLNESLKEIFDYWAPLARKKLIHYRFMPAIGNPQVQFDSLKLQHVISNLVENALKYTPSRGEVELKASTCFWDRRKAQNQFLFGLDRRVNRKIENAILIEVTDTGPGIPREHHEDIFLEFVRLQNSAQFRGTGLGLAIARRLIEAHGGVIWVKSQPGQGSNFSLLLPFSNK